RLTATMVAHKKKSILRSAEAHLGSERTRRAPGVEIRRAFRELVCFSESYPAHANQRRPIRRSVRRPGRGIDVLTLPQFREWKAAGHQATPVVQQLIQRPV